MYNFEYIQSLSRATVSDYVQLFWDAYGGDDKLTSQYLQWQYQNNPHGKVLGMDAFVGETLAAHYALIPRKYQYGARNYYAAFSVNTATHPEFQGKGLFTKLAEYTYSLAAECGVEFVAGAANANSVRGFTRKLGFVNLGQAGLYFGNALKKEDSNVLEIATDEEWLRWRLSNPSRSYRYRSCGENGLLIQTSVKNTIFNLAMLKGEEAILAHAITNPAHKLSQFMPSLTPYFGPNSLKSLRLPGRFQPSPWHIIWKSLTGSVPDDLHQSFAIRGLGMDTF